MVAADALRRLLREGKHGLDALAMSLKVTRGHVLDAIDKLRTDGYSVREGAGRFWLDTKPQSATDTGGRHEYGSRADGSYTFGFTSDNHLGSKYARHDVLAALFERFKAVGVDRVLNAGNWIDGEASFNKHDLTVHGMHQQCVHLADVWPRADFTTYAVAGDDHEGWYSQREGVDIGRYAEQCFKDAGRTDWVNLGYMEADIALVHAKTGVRTRLRVAHPGGGSAYATSYAPQKYIESLDGGEKPAVVLLGHWHKMEVLNIRNVWVIQTGCTQDQTPFGRKKRLDFHVGGGICRLVQDPDTGAIHSCTVEMLRFFNKAHYGTDRWSHHGPVTMADRAV
jgi:biotin operon repressor